MMSEMVSPARPRDKDSSKNPPQPQPILINPSIPNPPYASTSLPQQPTQASQTAQSQILPPASLPQSQSGLQQPSQPQTQQQYTRSGSRQDSLGNLLNNYTTYQNYPSYPSLPLREGPSDMRPRGDSVYLPPPVNAPFGKLNDKYDDPAGSGSGSGSGSFSTQLRSNSIFNVFNLNPLEKKRLSASDNALLQDFENYFNAYGAQNQQGSSKDSLSNLLQFPFSGSRSNSQGRKDLKLSKNSSVDMSNPNLWDNQALFNMGGSIAGQNYPQNLFLLGNSGSLSNLLQGLSNSIDFTNMNSEQRRDLILRFLADPNIRNSLSQQMPLREDIFKKGKIKEDDKLEVPKDVKNGPLLPTSSLSSKSEAKFDIPHSPKTSPDKSATSAGYMNSGRFFVPAMANIQNAIPPQDINSSNIPVPQPSSQETSPYFKSQYQNYISPNYTNYPFQGKEKKSNLQSNIPVEKDDKPKLGATKIDQLMLVIQAREKENKDIKIHTSEDGNIVGEVKPEHLVGGVEKHKLVPEDQEEDGKKKHRKKPPQCPYCEKFFAQSTQLEVHIRSHIGLKPYECTFCHKRFTQGGNLTTHLRLHTGEKPFTCDICNKSFSRKGNLGAHRLTHEKLKPYDCRLDGCDKSFTQLGNLKSHQNKFHLETLNHLTMKLAELTTAQIANLPPKEKELLEYFKNLYKNSNKGIKGRGKREEPQSQNQPQNQDVAAGSSNYRSTNYDQFA